MLIRRRGHLVFQHLPYHFEKVLADISGNLSNLIRISKPLCRLKNINEQIKITTTDF